jgi:HK97 family phage major capsid protein
VQRWWGAEILDLGSGSIRLERFRSASAALLMDHNTRDQIGVIESVKLKERRLEVSVRFGKGARAQEILTDVVDGIRRNVSIGYLIHDLKLERSSDTEGDTYRITDWEPYEASIVSVPADISVGIGRAAEEAGAQRQFVIGEQRMDEDDIQGGQAQNRSQPAATAPAQAPAATTINVQSVRDEARRAERDRQTQIRALSQRFNVPADLRTQFENGDQPVSEFRTAILDRMASRTPGTPPAAAGPEIGMSDRDVSRFRLTRLIAAMAFPSDTGLQRAAGFEFECARAAAERAPGDQVGMIVPEDVLSRGWINPEMRRALPAQQRGLVAASGSGANLVGDDLLGASFIELLRNRMALANAGVFIMSGLNGNVSIPRQTATGAVDWEGETDEDGQTDPTADQVTLSPKRAGATRRYSKQLLLQASIDVEAWLRMDLVTTLAIKIDHAGLYGTGSSNQPRGIINVSGVGKPTAFAGPVPTYAEVVALESAIAADNADIGAMSYIIEATMRGSLKTTEKATGTAQFVWEQGNTVNGYPAIVSNQVTSGDVFFGVWSQMLMGMWGALDLVVDPYSRKRTAEIEVTANRWVDFANRHPEAFAYNNDT